MHVQTDAVAQRVAHARTLGVAFVTLGVGPEPALHQQLAGRQVDVAPVDAGLEHGHGRLEGLQARLPHPAHLLGNLADHHCAGEVAAVAAGHAARKDVDDDGHVGPQLPLAPVVRQRVVG